MGPVRTSASSGTTLTPSDGSGTIYRTEAAKKYRLAPTDLDSILPVKIRKNDYGGRNEIKQYNISDVESLAARLSSQDFNPSTPTKKGTKVAASNPGLADKKPGGKILRTKAKKIYGLKDAQLDRILPVSEDPNPHGGTSLMRYYNLCDVKALHASVQAAAASPSKPTGIKTPKCTSYYDDDPFYEVGINGGMSVVEDIANLFH